MKMCYFSSMQSLTTLVAMITILLLSFSSEPVSSHGRMWEPPGRSSMWRVGFNTPVNYDDHGLNCGGYQSSPGNKCGVCGDPYNGERKNEAGGLYATGTISRTYIEGQQVNFDIELTANHLGWFEFKICPVNNPAIKATEECFDNNVLELVGKSDTKLLVEGSLYGRIIVGVQLPADLTCSQCVVQWRYHTANSWGTDPDGTSCVGCGPQEEFYGCSDVKIVSSSGIDPPTVAVPTTTTTTTTTQSPGGTGTGTGSGTSTGTAPGTDCDPDPNTTATTGTTSGVCRSVSGLAAYDKWCVDNCALGHCPESLCTCDDNAKLLTCYGYGTFKDDPKMDEWCLINCRLGFCPDYLCFCPCSDIGAPNEESCKSLTGVQAYDIWCANNCAMNHCPSSLCTCDPDYVPMSCNAIGSFKDNVQMDKWCVDNCRLGFCPGHLCTCQ